MLGNVPASQPPASFFNKLLERLEGKVEILDFAVAALMA